MAVKKRRCRYIGAALAAVAAAGMITGCNGNADAESKGSVAGV